VVDTVDHLLDKEGLGGGETPVGNAELAWIQEIRKLHHRARKIAGSWGQVLGTLHDMKAEVEYTALVSVKVDLETGEVASVGIYATRDEDETPSEVSVSLESETDQPDAVFDRAQQLVDAAAPFEAQTLPRT